VCWFAHEQAADKADVALLDSYVKNTPSIRLSLGPSVLMTLIGLLLMARLSVAAPFSYGPLTVYFTRGSAEITRSGQATIKELATTLRGKAVREVRLEGFSDRVAVSAKNPFANNQALSQARALAVSRALQAATGLAPGLFSVSGQGEAEDDHDGPGGQAKGRRVEIRVLVEDGGALSGGPSPVLDASPGAQPRPAERITLSLRKVEVAEVFEMLSKKHRLNIMVDKAVEGVISVNLYEVTLEEAINTIAASAGCEVRHDGTGIAITPKPPPGPVAEPVIATEIRTYPVQYAESEKIETILTKHLSKSGKVTALKGRNLVVVEDTPLVLDKLGALLKEIDRPPKQILIEAKILEITLSESESFGLNWWKIFTSSDSLLRANDDKLSSAGVRGLSTSNSGFIFNLVNDNVNIALDALNKKGKVKTLSTPKILSLENQESSVIIGDRKGYTVTTTINQVTTTSIQFLESGVILKVTPSVDSDNRILLQIHPEVSSGSVTAGIPSQTTTEVTTSLLAKNGQAVFIGGLLKKKSDSSKEGVPLLEDIPVLGHAFSNTKDNQENAETVVLITPYLIAQASDDPSMTRPLETVEGAERGIDRDQQGKVPATEAVMP